MARDLTQHAPELLARPVEVVRRLHPEPQFGPVAAEVTEPHCHLRGNGGRARKDVVQCLPRHAELARRLASRRAFSRRRTRPTRSGAIFAVVPLLNSSASPLCRKLRITVKDSTAPRTRCKAMLYACREFRKLRWRCGPTRHEDGPEPAPAAHRRDVRVPVLSSNPLALPGAHHDSKSSRSSRESVRVRLSSMSRASARARLDCWSASTFSSTVSRAIRR